MCFLVDPEEVLPDLLALEDVDIILEDPLIHAVMHHFHLKIIHHVLKVIHVV